MRGYSCPKRLRQHGRRRIPQLGALLDGRYMLRAQGAADHEAHLAAAAD